MTWTQLHHNFYRESLLRLAASGASGTTFLNWHFPDMKALYCMLKHLKSLNRFAPFPGRGPPNDYRDFLVEVAISDPFSKWAHPALTKLPKATSLRGLSLCVCRTCLDARQHRLKAKRKTNYVSKAMWSTLRKRKKLWRNDGHPPSGPMFVRWYATRDRPIGDDQCEACVDLARRSNLVVPPVFQNRNTTAEVDLKVRISRGMARGTYNNNVPGPYVVMWSDELL